MRHADILDISAVPGLRGIAEEAERLAHRRAHHLDRPHPRRAAAAVRRPEARRARGRRRADPEPRHARRQHLHGLAGRRRRAQPAGAGRQRRAGEPAGPRASCPWASSSTAIATPSAAPTRSSPPSSCPSGASATRSHFLKLGARKYLVISIVMVAGVIEMDAGGRISGRAPRHRLLLGQSRSACRRSGSALVGAAVGDGCGPGGGLAFRAARADRRHPRLGGLSARGGAGADARSAARSWRRPTRRRAA